MIFFPIIMRRSKPVTHEKPLEIQITDAQIELNKIQLELNAETARQIVKLKQRVELLEKATPPAPHGYEEGGEI